MLEEHDSDFAQIWYKFSKKYFQPLLKENNNLQCNEPQNLNKIFCYLTSWDGSLLLSHRCSMIMSNIALCFLLLIHLIVSVDTLFSSNDMLSTRYVSLIIGNEVPFKTVRVVRIPDASYQYCVNNTEFYNSELVDLCIYGIKLTKSALAPSLNIEPFISNIIFEVLVFVNLQEVFDVSSYSDVVETTYTEGTNCLYLVAVYPKNTTQHHVFIEYLHSNSVSIYNQSLNNFIAMIDSNPDFNVHLHGGDLYVQQLNSINANSDIFYGFKSYYMNDVHRNNDAIGLFDIYFRYWYMEHCIYRIHRSIIELSQTHVHILQAIYVLSEVDNSVGNPVLLQWDMKPVLKLKTPSYGIDIPDTIFATPVQLRYLLEASQLESVFSRGALVQLFHTNSNVIEIGGGYGGFAITLEYLYGSTYLVDNSTYLLENGDAQAPVCRYMIVDIPEAGVLQQNYVQHIHSMHESLLRRNRSRVDIISIPSHSKLKIRSNLLVSFFALSELRKDVVNHYIQAYVRYANCGFIQLNYDELPSVEGDIAVKSEAGGRSDADFNDEFEYHYQLKGNSNSQLLANEEAFYAESYLLSMNRIEKCHLYTMAEMFRVIYKHQPNAMLLPPPRPEYHRHHRIVWKNTDTCK